MEFKRKFGNKQRKQPKKGVFLILLLLIVLFIWFKAESIIKFFF